MKTFLFFILSLTIFSTGFSQQLERTVIASLGNNFKNSTINAQWTIGEIAIQSFESDNIILTEGFHQTKLDTVVSTFDFGDYVTSIQVFPNPTSNLIYFEIKGKKLDSDFTIELFDQNGKKLMTEKPTSASGQINLGKFPSGIFYGKMFSKNSQVETFKIEKIN